MESTLVGEDLNGCAFVYGSLSFLDKLSCGLALYALESYEGKTSVGYIHLYVKIMGSYTIIYLVKR